MPRKKRVKEPTSVAEVLEQSPVAAMIADQSPTAAEQAPTPPSPEAQTPTLDAFLDAREAKSQIDPERPMPEPEQRHEEKPRPERPSLPDTDPDLPTLPSSNGKPHDGEEAVAAFKRQRERELAVSEAPPQTSQNRPDRQVKSWGETVRGWTSHGETGVRHVTTTSPDMVGIAFPREKPRTEDEKREMEDIGLRFFKDAQAWLKSNRDGAFDETQDLARTFAQRRRERAAEIER